jgi:hypothetical protein
MTWACSKVEDETHEKCSWKVVTWKTETEMGNAWGGKEKEAGWLKKKRDTLQIYIT